MEDKKDYVLLGTNNSNEMYTQLTEKYKSRKPWKTPDPKEIKAFIPGTVQEILVKPGDVVKEGTIILILVAMKMENKVMMPFDGTIKSVNVASGDRIAKQVIMIEIE